MPVKIIVSSGEVAMPATLNDTPAAATVASNLPIEGLAQTRGAEVFFFVDFPIDPGEGAEEVPPGTIAYWPVGSAICIFYGSRPVTPVEVVGTLDGDPTEWRNVVSGDSMRMEKA